MKVIINHRVVNDLMTPSTIYSYSFKQKYNKNGYNYITVARVTYKICDYVEKNISTHCLDNVISCCWKAYCFTKKYRIPDNTNIYDVKVRQFGLGEK